MRAAMAFLPLFPESDLTAPLPAGAAAADELRAATAAAVQPAARGRPVPRSPDAAPAIQPVSAGRAAGLQQLAHLWRADEIAPAAGRDATVASGFAALDAELPGGGWPQGQLVELLLDAPGIGELSLLAPALARCTQDARACVWVLPCERAASTALPTLPYPPALAAAGVDLARALFVQPETPREAFWAIEQSLRAAHLGALLAWLPPTTSSREGEFRALRRLQLLAGRQQALVFLLRDARALHAPSPAALRLQLAARDGELAVTILKRRGRPLLDPVALQVHPAHWRHAEAAAPADDTPEPQTQPPGRLAQAALLAQRWSAKVIFSH
jgi:hypothetical protein